MAENPTPNGAGPEKRAEAHKRRCTGTTKAGKPCSATPRKDTGTCNAHAPKEVRESAGFGGPQPGAGRPRSPKAVEILRERMEANADRYLQPLEDGLTADRGVVVGDGDSARVEFVTDHGTRIKASLAILDRVYGKPMQFHDVTTREEESEVDREIRALLEQMDQRDAPSLNGNGNGKVSH